VVDMTSGYRFIYIHHGVEYLQRVAAGDQLFAEVKVMREKGRKR
jgi:acyl dehydratase